VKVGFHVSISGSIDQAVDRADASGYDTFQMFTRNPRGWKYTALEPEEVKSFKTKLRQAKIGPPVDHMPYLPNLSCPEQEVYEKSVATLVSEVERCITLGVPYIVTHLGSHLGLGREIGLQRISDALNLALRKARGDMKILLENMAGQRNSMGSSFQDIKEIMSGVKNKRHVGVCLDTCHCYAAGLDLHTEKGVEQTLTRFNDTIGFENLKVVHINDSKGGLGSGLDRHEHIGMGYIGEKGFRAFLRHTGIRDIPMILETPIDDRCDDQGNLAMVRKLGK